MRPDRQSLILEIIREKDIETQEEIVAELQKRGCAVTQATVSRDIKDMRLIKTMSENGKYKYTPVDLAEKDIMARQLRLFAESVVSADCANNLIVLKTVSGSANAAGSTVDSFRWPEILGTIAGDDTILVVAKNNDAALSLMKRFREMMK